MRLLLDTHSLLWWAHESKKLSKTARESIADGENDVLISAVSAMEIATKHRKGTLEYQTPLAHQFVSEVTGRGFQLLPISCDHAEQAGRYAVAHKDPWDRLLAAQAQIEGLALVTIDRAFADFDVQTLW